MTKKRHSSKIKRRPEEILSAPLDYKEIIEEIQKETWAYTLETKTMIPSIDCLNLREKNMSFQMQIWSQATKPKITVQNPEEYGWLKEDSGFYLKADSKSNMKKQASIYETIMRKCGCSKCQCKSERCKCRSNGSFCSSFCNCKNCKNTDKMKNKANEEQNAQLWNEPVMEEEDGDISTSGSETEEAIV